MKILHIVQTKWFNAEVQYAWDLVKHMGRAGHEAHCLAIPSSYASAKAGDMGLKTHTEGGFGAKRFQSWKIPAALARFNALLARERYDAVMVHRSESMVPIALICRFKGVPCFRVRGDMRPVKENAINRWAYGKLLDAVIASNQSIASSLMDRLGVEATVVRGGVDENLFTPEGPKADIRSRLGFESGAFLVGLLGRMERIKGHADFLDAASMVLKKVPGAAFVIMAKSGVKPLPELKARLDADPHLNERTRIVGHLDDLPEVLRDFNLGVVASLESEANCRVGLEWMASGVPLVATRVGVLPEMVDEGVTGHLTSISDPGGMAESILLMAADPLKTKEMGKNARKAVIDRFTLDRTAGAIMELIEKGMAARR